MIYEIAAIVGAGGAVATAVSVLFLAKQTAEGRRQSELANRLALVAVHDRIADLSLLADSIFIERPELRKYFYHNEDYKSLPPLEQERVIAIAEFLSDFIENTLLRELHLTEISFISWSRARIQMVRDSPAVRDYLDRNRNWYHPLMSELLEEAIAGLPPSSLHNEADGRDAEAKAAD